MCCFDLQRNEEALRSENSNIGICEYKIITGDNKMINQDLYEMIFKRKSFHLFRNVGDKRLSIKEIEDIKKTYKTYGNKTSSNLYFSLIDYISVRNKI